MARMRPLPSSFVLVFALAAGVAAQEAPKKLARDVVGTVTGAGKEKVRITIWLDDMQRGTLDPSAEGFAADDGSFTLRAVPWFEKQQWGNRSFLVVARSASKVGVAALRGDDARADQVKIELAEPVELRGVVRNKETGLPVANVGVWANNFGDWQRGKHVFVTQPLPAWSATSDAEGKFVLKGLPRIAPLALTAMSDEYARTRVEGVDPEKPVDIDLPLGGRIRGTVLLPDGKPAARVRVRTAGHGTGYGDTISADDGTFCLGGLAADVYKVWAEVDDLTVIAVLDLRVNAGDEIDKQTVQLVKGGFIVGRIVEKATGKSITPGPWTDVAMYGPARGRGGACECTPVLADGTFRIRAPAGKNHIYLRAADGYDEPSEDVTVVEGQETKVEWRVIGGPAGGRAKK
jgi:hypothetical protein